MTIYTGELTFSIESLVRLTDESAWRAAAKSLLVWLRKQAKVHRWAYDIRISLSVYKAHTARTKEARPHFHFIIMGNPGSTIGNFITKYWSQRYGTITTLEKLYTWVDVYRKLEYISEQAAFTWNQQHNIDQLDGGIEAFLRKHAGNQMSPGNQGAITFLLPQHHILVNNIGENSSGNQLDKEELVSVAGVIVSCAADSNLMAGYDYAAWSMQQSLQGGAAPISPGNAPERYHAIGRAAETLFTSVCSP